MDGLGRDVRKKHPMADFRGNANFKGRRDKEKSENKINMMIWEVGNGKKIRKKHNYIL